MKVIAWPAFKTRYKNPYTWLIYSNMPRTVSVTEFSVKQLLIERFDVLHLHWPVETLVRHPNIWMARGRVLLFWLLMKLSKWRGTKIVWTIHDSKPHVVLHPSLANWFQERLIANTDGCINLCTAGQIAMTQTLSKLAHKPSFVIPHGHYRGCYPNDLSRTDARLQLTIAPETITLLYLGYISPYKNVPHLIDTFRQLPETTNNITLIIAGQPDTEQIEQTIRSTAEGALNLQLHLRFIKDEELQIFFKAADIVVLPFEEILNSGSLLLALSFDRPVIVPHLGAVSHWQTQIGSDWIKAYQGVLTPEILLSTITSHRPSTAQAPLESLNWDAIAQQTLKVYQALTPHTLTTTPLSHNDLANP
jgi:beta-1,4-mannosyltransferase